MSVLHGFPNVKILEKILGSHKKTEDKPTSTEIDDLLKITPGKINGDMKSQLICILATMGKLANIDGNVSQEETENIKTYLNKLKFKDTDIKWAFHHFNNAIKDNATYVEYCNKYYELVHGDFDHCLQFASLLMELCLSDQQFHKAEKEAMVNIIKTLRLPKDSFEKLLFQKNVLDKTSNYKIRSSGTGFIITNDGFIISNSHVISEGSQISVIANNKLYHATALSREKKHDLCIIKIDGKFEPVRFSQNSLYPGQNFFTIGYPLPKDLGYQAKISKGDICGLSDGTDDCRHIQINAAIHPGNSGGPLIDSVTGQCLGVIKACHKKVIGVNYAIRYEILLRFLKNKWPKLHSRLNYSNFLIQDKAALINETQKSVVQILACNK